MSFTTTTTTTAAGVGTGRRGFRLQRHLDAAFTAPLHFGKERIHRAKIKTGITMEYALHSRSHDATSGEKNVQEVRVLLVMGFLNTKETWTPTIETMLSQWEQQHPNSSDARLTVLTFDNRGVGGSTSPLGPYTTQQMAEDALALLDHVGWTHSHVIGYSLGGMISLEIAALAPERIDSLSLLCTTRGRFIPAYQGISPMSKTLVYGDTDVETHNLLMVLYPAEFLSRGMEIDDPDGASGRSIYEALYECHKHLVDNRETPRVFGFVGQSAAIMSHYVSDERLQAIRDHRTYPIMVIGASEDVVVPAREAKTLYEHLASDNVRLVMYQDAGHGVFVQYLDEVAGEILRTITSAPTN